MIVEWKFFILCLPVAFLFLLWCYVTGGIISRLCAIASKKQELNIEQPGTFWKLTAGLFILSSLYAIFQTRAQTSILPVVVLAVMMLIKTKSPPIVVRSNGRSH